MMHTPLDQQEKGPHMSNSELLALLPYIILSGTAVITMLVISVYRRFSLTAVLSFCGLAGTFVSLTVLFPVLPLKITALLVIDKLTFFYMGLTVAAALVTGIFAFPYLEHREGLRDEFYLLLLLATLGGSILIASGHFASLLLGLETLSVSLYGLIAFQRFRDRSIEAGLKYLVLAGTSSAFLAFGMALLYARLGSMDFSTITMRISGTDAGGIVIVAGTLLIITGLGFKLALVPFHMWTPDVYEGAPAPVTAFIATISKGTVFVLILRYFGIPEISVQGSLFTIMSVIAAASIIAGNILALFQDNIKRILAYSSIAHLGYITVAFLASGDLAVTAITFYLVAYFMTMLGTFGVMIFLSDREGDAEHIEQYRSLAWREPWLAVVFTVMLFSLAGIPLTAGFVGKFYVLAAGVKSSLWFLLTTLVIGSALGIFYYLRIILVMFSGKNSDASPSSSRPVAPGSRLVLAILTLALIWLGTYPEPLIRMIGKTVQIMK